MKICIKMTNGNVYMINAALNIVVDRIDNSETLLRIPGTEGRDDFYINPLQVSAVYPARED